MKILESKPINPFGGLNFVIEAFDKLGVDKLLADHLPTLPSQTVYSWRDLVYSFWSIFYCGGDCIEDLSGNFNKSLTTLPHLKIPSPDRVLSRMKELAVATKTYTTPRGKSQHDFCHDMKINCLNLKLCKLLNSFNEAPITLDYDNTVIFTRKKDAKMTYHKEFGYAPGVGIIGNKIVYVENRNGNSDAQTLQQDTLRRMFKLLKSEDIKVDNFRADSASFQFTTLLEVTQNVDRFYIRVRMTSPLYQAIQQIDNWEKVKSDEGDEIYRGDTYFIPFSTNTHRHKEKHPKKAYRLVVTKIKRRDKQLNVFTQDCYNYQGIITNDEEKNLTQIVDFYNQRGTVEKEFDVLKNDFGWNNMPFSKLNQNTIFLVFTAMCRNLYDYLIKNFSQKYKGLNPNYRIKKFIFRFICIPAKWIKSARTYKLKVYGKIAFKT